MFLQRQLDFLDKVGQDHLIVTLDLDDPPCAKYIKKDTKEYYELASFQHTISFNSSKEILSEAGLKLFNEAQEKYNRGEYKDVFIDYVKTFSNSGSWYSDSKSKYYDPNALSVLNSWNDICVSGTWKSNGNKMTTTPVILITSEWCLTKNGSLYKLIDKLE